MTGVEAGAGDQGVALLTMYDHALPQVYGYLAARTRNAVLAEDLASETFLAAAQAVRRDAVPDLTVAWLITVARNKLVDHWRRQEREERSLRLIESPETVEDDLEQHFERQRARDVLEQLGAHHRAALTLRYLDALSVPEVAALLGRTVHATEALLVRARNAFRVAYAEGGCDDN
ncbi:MAG TPA: sigma-70 family RNA polymerase sigma factor [Acidimicrobiales bacterium]|jgi:RNA polymerase sigma-70 factor (ECF subfamily)